MKKLKKYKVRLEFRIRDSIEVEAYSDKEAEDKALELVEISAANSQHYDTQIEEL